MAAPPGTIPGMPLDLPCGHRVAEAKWHVEADTSVGGWRLRDSKDLYTSGIEPSPAHDQTQIPEGEPALGQMRPSFWPSLQRHLATVDDPAILAPDRLVFAA